MEIIHAMRECLALINSYIIEKDHIKKVSDEEFKQTESRLGIRFPQPLMEFYRIFGNNVDVLNAYFQFERLEDIKIENNAVVFCHGHQAQRTFGILLSDINNENPPLIEYKGNPPVSMMNFGGNEWYSACRLSTSFFVNITCWQVVNFLPSVARVKIVEDKLRSTVEKNLKPISHENSIALGFNFYSFYDRGNKILASYARDLGELYLASEDDCYLKKFKSESKMKLDWL